jgi:hypothetical protein
MASSHPVGRSLTLLACGFLGLDGAALVGLGVRAGRPGLVATGLVLLACSGLVLWYWRRHLRRLDEIAAQRRALRAEAEDMRRLLRE